MTVFSSGPERGCERGALSGKTWVRAKCTVKTEAWGGLVVCVWVLCTYWHSCDGQCTSFQVAHRGPNNQSQISLLHQEGYTPTLLSAESHSTPLGAKSGQARHQAQNERNHQPVEPWSHHRHTITCEGSYKIRHNIASWCIMSGENELEVTYLKFYSNNNIRDLVHKVRILLTDRLSTHFTSLSV